MINEFYMEKRGMRIRETTRLETLKAPLDIQKKKREREKEKEKLN